MSTAPGEFTEAELVRRFLHGEYAGFEILHREHHGRLLAFLTPRCRPPLSVDDAAQEIWLKVHRMLGTWKPDRPFSAWLLTIARNHCINLYREIGRIPKTEVVDDIDLPPRNVHATTPQLDAMRECLDELGGDFVPVLRMRIHLELDDREIADRLGIPLGTIHSRVNRGKSQVKDCVERKLS